MIKGLYSAASAMLANLTRQATISHNVSNLDTPGFKSVMVSLDDFLYTPVAHPTGRTVSGGAAAGWEEAPRWIGALGLGVDTTPESTDFAPGGLRETGNPLDVAIQGPAFFRVLTPNGERYTRDGRFQRDQAGNLVTVDGYKVLNDGGQPITLPEGQVNLAPDGTLTVIGANNQPANAGRIGLAFFADPAANLTRDLPNTFAGTPTPPAAGTAGSLHQGYLEMSNANPANLMTQMVAVGRAYEAAQRMVQNQDELLGKAIASLGGF